MRRFSAYAVAVAASILALVPWLLAGTRLEPSPFPLFVAAVAVAAWYGGRGPGVLAAFLGAIEIAYVYLAPRSSAAVSSIQSVVQLAVFLVVALLVTWLNTARQRAEREQRYLAEIVASSQDAIVGLNLEGRVTSWNRAAERFYGYQASEVLGRPFSLIFPQELHERASRVIGQLMRGERVAPFEYSITRPDGSTTDVSVQFSAIRDVEDRIAGISSIGRDVSERKRIEAERADLARQKEVFLLAAAHDLKTPLTTIKGVAQLLQRRIDRDGITDIGRIQQGLAQIETMVTKMTGLLNSLLEVTRGEATMVVNPETLDLVQLTKSVVDELQQVSPGHRILIETELSTLTGTWDRTRLERAISNLLMNAVRYSPDGEEIMVRVEQNESEAIVTVVDRGIGIPREDLPHVFERFHRGSNVTADIPGTGLGLASVHQIAEQHGGAVAVESQEGEGSAFTLRLPLRPTRIEEMKD